MDFPIKLFEHCSASLPIINLFVLINMQILNGWFGHSSFPVFSNLVIIPLLENYYINNSITDYKNTFWLPLYQPNSVGANIYQGIVTGKMINLEHPSTVNKAGCPTP